MILEKWLLLLKLLLCISAVATEGPSNRTIEARLVDQLTSNYDRRVRPRMNASETVDVTFAFYMTRVDILNLRSEMLSVTGWIVVRWYDDIFRWDPAQYDNITKLVLPTSSVWLPIIALDNSVDNIIEKNFRDNFYVLISYTGLMSWEPGGVFTTSCEMDITLYPFDRQTCTMFFSTWDYTVDLVNLTFASPEVDRDAYVENGEWEILSTKVEGDRFSYNNSPEMIYPEVAVTIQIRRKSTYYFINILTPCLMMSCLVLMVFYLPPDSGEKVSLGVTVLLAFSVFQLMIAEDMPTSASAMPILEVYLLCFMSASTFSVIISVLVLNLHHRTEYNQPPVWLRRLVLDFLGHWLCMGTRSHTTDVQPIVEEYHDHMDQVEAKIEIDHHDEPATSCSNPKIVLPDSPAESTHTFHPTSGLLGASCQNLRTGAAISAVKLIHSIANIDKTSGTQSKTAFLSAVRDVYQELYQTRMAGEVEAALENQWKQIARVVDRFFFWLTFSILIVSTAIIFDAARDRQA
ncbi:neuronal acetylcholine receptor subunit non-alpha-2-like [Haliotis cracherodii]|uniref:neuronal acetylcholine receptor subunit non-alpha-2-like n=1 Tax=Haliotis cracherodii TaxID=6455 RepID=UPI0039ED2C1E